MIVLPVIQIGQYTSVLHRNLQDLLGVTPVQFPQPQFVWQRQNLAEEFAGK